MESGTRFPLTLPLPEGWGEGEDRVLLNSYGYDIQQQA